MGPGAPSPCSRVFYCSPSACVRWWSWGDSCLQGCRCPNSIFRVGGSDLPGRGRGGRGPRGGGGAGPAGGFTGKLSAPLRAGSSNELIIVRAGVAGFGPPRAATRAGEGTRAAGLGRCRGTRVFRPRPTAQGSGIPGSPETAPTGPAGARLLPQRWPRALRSTRRRALGAEQRAFILQVGKLKPREMK